MKGDSARVLDAVARGLVGLLAACLPRRLWPSWEGRVPIAGLATPAALLTFLLGFGLGAHGYFLYLQRTAPPVSRLVTDAAERQFDEAGGTRPPAPPPALPATLSSLSLFAFALHTSLGLLCTYLLGSAFLRVLAGITGHPMGDPVLTLADHAAVRQWRRRSADHVRAERARLEGPDVPDVLLTGEEAGMPDAELVVVASRQKVGWEKNVFVVTTGRWYRIGTPVDRRLPEGLRALYPLAVVRDVEALRRSVSYDHPRLSALDAAEERALDPPAE